MVFLGLQKKYVILLMMIFLGGVFFFYRHFFQHQHIIIPKIPALKLSYSTVPIDRTYIGITQSIASVDIRARVKGFLTELHFIEGDPVKKDQLLFVIDPKPFQLKVSEAEARLAKAMADENFLKVQYARMKTLVAKGNVSQAKYDEVKAQYQAATAEIALADAFLNEAKIDLSYCYMKAPFDGLIGKKQVNIGNLVGSTESTVLATVNQLDPMYVQFSPSITDYSDMIAYEKNRPFKVEAMLPEHPEFNTKGILELVDNLANTATSSILMRATIKNPKSLLLPGLYVQTKVHLGDNPQAICVPRDAIMEDQGQKTVYVVDEKNIVQVAEIEAPLEYGNQSIVTKGLKIGQIVLTGAIQKLQPGMVVSPQLGHP